MKMDIRCEGRGNIQVVQVSGRIDGTTAELFGRDIAGIIAHGNRQILLDLTSVPYINSAGLRAILAAAKSLKKPGDRCALCGLSDEVRKIFDLAGLSRVLTIYLNVPDALSRWEDEQR